MSNWLPTHLSEKFTFSASLQGLIMSPNFSKKTPISRTVSTATIFTNFRKLSTALRPSNEKETETVRHNQDVH